MRAFTADESTAFFDAIGRAAQIAGRPEQARRVLRACLILAGVDGRTHPGELAAIRAIRSVLGLDPSPGGANAAPLPLAITIAAVTEEHANPPVRSAAPTKLRSANAGIVRTVRVRVPLRRAARPMCADMSMRR